MIRELVKNAAARLGFGVFKVRGRYHEDGLFTIHSQAWRDAPEFRAAYARGIQASNGVDPGIEWRVHVAFWAASVALDAPGDFVECGVNAGFISSAIMHKLDWSNIAREFYLIDTFTGPVLGQYSSEEISRGRLEIAQASLAHGAYVTDLDRVRANFSEWPNAVVIPGAVPEILRARDFGQVAFVHIDMNCAAPEIAAFEFFWDRLPPGGVILFDDYGYWGHDSQRQAVDHAAQRLGCAVLSLPTGQGLIVKSSHPFPSR